MESELTSLKKEWESANAKGNEIAKSSSDQEATIKKLNEEIRRISFLFSLFFLSFLIVPFQFLMI